MLASAACHIIIFNKTKTNTNKNTTESSLSGPQLHPSIHPSMPPAPYPAPCSPLATATLQLIPCTVHRLFNSFGSLTQKCQRETLLDSSSHIVHLSKEFYLLYLIVINETNEGELSFVNTYEYSWGI